MDHRVSVVITTFNHASYIEQTLASVFAQTYEPFEVIVVDDGSTDETPLRIAPFMERIVYIRQANQGVAGSRNTGIRKARGELIAFLDGDDLWEPDKLAVQVAAARSYPDSGLIVVDGCVFDESGVLVTTLFCGSGCNEVPQGAIASGNFYHKLLNGPFISTTSQVMVPARILQQVGLSNERYMRASDYDLYVRIAAKFNFTIVRKQLSRWRYHSSSVSGPRITRTLTYLPEDIAILRNHLRECDRQEKSLIRRIIKKRLSQGAEALYHYGLETDKPFAGKGLLKLFLENFPSPVTAAFLVALWFPEQTRQKIAPVVRRMLLRNDQ